MVKVNFYINNNLVNPPENWRALEIELNFDRDRTNVRESVTLTTLDWVRENADFLLDYREDGVGIGVGILEAPALRIEIERGGVIEKPFDGYIDTAASGKWSKIRTSLTAKERKKIDWLNDVADGFTFEYLYKSTGEITDNDFIFVPYILSSVPDYKESAIALLTVAFIGNELRSAINELAKASSAMSSYFYYTAVLALILEIIYIAALLITLVKLIKDVILFLIQPVKYHAGMKAKRLFEAGCNHLGLTFKSDIFDTAPYEDLCIIPQKYQNLPDVTEPRIFGFQQPDKTKQNGYYQGTFGQYIRDMKVVHNAKVEIRKNLSNNNDELWFIRDDVNLSTPQYQLADIQNFDSDTNVDEFRANYYLKFEIDTTDRNTVQEYTGTAYQQILSPIRVNDASLILMKGLERIDIPFAQAKRKEDLTVPEEIVDFFLTVFNSLVNGIAAVINGVISVVNFITSKINNLINALGVFGINISFNFPSIPQINYVNLNNLIDNRIGMMKIETDYFNIPKLVLLDIKSLPKNTKITAQNSTYLSAEYLWKNFHFIKSWLPSAAKPNGNQYLIKTFEKVPFTFTDYLKVKDSNIIFDYQGKEAEVISLKWNPYSLVADMTIRFSTLLTDNLQLTELIPNGQ